MENRGNNHEQHISGIEGNEATELASRSLSKVSGDRKPENLEGLSENSPTQNLYLAIFGKLPEHDVDEADVPELLDWLLTSTGSEREGEIVVRHFGIANPAETYAKIAKEAGVSRAAIQTVGQEALASLKGRRSEFIKRFYATRSELRGEFYDQRREFRGQIAELQQQVADLSSKLEIERAKNSRLLGDNSEPELAAKGILIEDLDLSVRAFNCLKRAGLNTTGEILAEGKEKVRKIRHLGYKGFDEIEAKLGQLGLSFKDD